MRIRDDYENIPPLEWLVNADGGTAMKELVDLKLDYRDHREWAEASMKSDEWRKARRAALAVARAMMDAEENEPKPNLVNSINEIELAWGDVRHCSMEALKAQENEIQEELKRVARRFNLRRWAVTIRGLVEVNEKRILEVYNPVDEWSPTNWGCAVAGEVMELCNLLMKERRGEDIPTKAIADGMADVMIYLCCLSSRVGIDLEQAVVSKFNEVSKREGSSYYLAGDASE